MAPKVCVPMDFGRHLIGSPTHSNLKLNTSEGGEVNASSVILSYNSPVIDHMTTTLHMTSVDMLEFGEAAVRLFVDAAYSGTAEGITKETFRDINKIANVFKVAWLVEKCAECFAAVADSIVTPSYTELLFLFDEAVFVLEKLKTKDFMRTCFKKIEMLKWKSQFIDNYLEDAERLSTLKLDMVIELAGAEVEIVVQKLTRECSGYALEQGLPKYCEYLLENSDLSLCRISNRVLFDQLFDTFDNLPEHKAKWTYTLLRKSTMEKVTVAAQKKTKFDDNVASTSSQSEIIENNIGDSENRAKAIKIKEEEAHLYMAVEAVTDESFHGYQGHDLLNWSIARPTVYRVKKERSFREVVGMIARKMGYPVNNIRLWEFHLRGNSTMRPASMGNQWENSLWAVAEEKTPIKVFIETVDQRNPSKGLMPYNEDEQILIFLKYFDVVTDRMHYLTHVFVSPDKLVGSVLEEARRRIGLHADVPLELYEEIQPGRTEILFLTELVGELDDTFDGDIWVAQRTDIPGTYHDTVRDYFQDLCSRMSVQFCDMNNPTDPGFHVVLNSEMTYKELAEVVCNSIDSQPSLIQFFKPQSHRDIAGCAIKSNFQGTLRKLFKLCDQKTMSPNKLFYRKLNMAISELESRDHFSCTWLNKHRQETVLSLYVANNVTIAELLEEAKKLITLSPFGSGKLRLLEVHDYRIHRVFSNIVSIRDIQPSMAQQTSCYRIEEIPVEEIRLGPKEFLITVAYFHQTIFLRFSHPFLFKVSDGETLQSVRTRMLERFKNNSEEVFDKCNFSLITHGRRILLNNESTFKSSDFITNVENDAKPIAEAHFDLFLYSRPWLGLEIAVKPPKLLQYTNMKKPINMDNQL